MAVAERNERAVQILLDAGADPELRTWIDECETPLDMARAAGLSDTVALLETAELRMREARARRPT